MCGHLLCGRASAHQNSVMLCKRNLVPTDPPFCLPLSTTSGDPIVSSISMSSTFYIPHMNETMQVSSWAWWFHLTIPPVPSIFLFPNEACLVVYQAALQPGWALYPSTTAHTSNPDPLLAFSTILIPMQRTECRSPPLIWTILIENVLGFHCDFTFHVPNTQY